MGGKDRQLTLEENKAKFYLLKVDKSRQKIADIRHLTSSTISRFLKRLRRRGSVESKHRCGRIRFMTVCNQKALSKIVKKTGGKL